MAGLLACGSMSLIRLPKNSVALWTNSTHLQLRGQLRYLTVFPFNCFFKNKEANHASIKLQINYQVNSFLFD